MAVGLLATAALSMLGRWIAAKHMYGSVAMVNSVIAVTAGLADTFGPNGTERFALSFLVAVIWIQIAQAAQMGKESFFRLNALLLRLCTLMIIFLGAVRYDLSITLTTVFLTFIACTVFVTACAIYLRSRSPTPLCIIQPNPLSLVPNPPFSTQTPLFFNKHPVLQPQRPFRVHGD